MRLPQDYDSEPLVEAIIANDWSRDHAAAATKIIRALIAERYGERLDNYDAIWLLGSLLNRRLLRAEIHPNDVSPRGSDARQRQRTKYVRIPPDGR